MDCSIQLLGLWSAVLAVIDGGLRGAFFVQACLYGRSFLGSLSSQDLFCNTHFEIGLKQLSKCSVPSQTLVALWES